MRGTLADLLILLMYFQLGRTNEYSGSQDGRNSCASGYCSVEDEGPCKDDGEAKLYRWDPVKVCGHLEQVLNQSERRDV